ncbi:hypothetical protein [Shouchella clausii]|nr:hypothetical protein [Shouchella clausii]KKI86311.1 hypothetical protein WZ76_11125 [Shouchella clausii]
MMTQLAMICLAVIGATFIGFPAARWFSSSTDKRLPAVKWAMIGLPVLASLPFIEAAYDFYNQYSQSILGAIINTLLSQGEGRVLMLVVLLTAFMFILLTRSRDAKTDQRVLFFTGLVLVFIVQLLHPALEYGSWLGYVLSSLHALGLSLLTGMFASLAFFNRKNAQVKIDNRKTLVVVLVASFLVMVVAEVGLVLLLAPDYITSMMTYYGHWLVVSNLLHLPLGFFVLKHGVEWVMKKTDQGWTCESFLTQGFFAGTLLLIQAIMVVYLPPQNVLRTLESEPMSPVTLWAVDGNLATYQVIGISEGPIRFVVVYLTILFFLAALVIAVFSRKAIWTALISSAVAVVIYGGTLTLFEAGDILVDDTVFPTVTEAVKASYKEDAEIEVLLEEEDESALYLVYAIDDQDLGIEKLDIVSEGFKRVPLSGVVIDNGMTNLQEQAMETRKLDNGNWLDPEMDYAYVSFGTVKRTENAESVQIHFEDKYVSVPVNENRVFFHIETTNKNWPERHLTYLLNANGKKVAEYQYESMTGGFHH